MLPKGCRVLLEFHSISALSVLLPGTIMIWDEEELAWERFNEI